VANMNSRSCNANLRIVYRCDSCDSEVFVIANLPRYQSDKIHVECGRCNTIFPVNGMRRISDGPQESTPN
jgi:hypothetical protein